LFGDSLSKHTASTEKNRERTGCRRANRPKRIVLPTQDLSGQTASAPPMGHASANRYDMRVRTLPQVHHVVDAHILIGGLQLLAAVGNHQQLVPDKQVGFALRHEIVAVAVNHHHQRIIGQRDLTQQ